MAWAKLIFLLMLIVVELVLSASLHELMTEDGEGGTSRNETMTLVKLDLKQFPQAKCLDGSPGAYYISPGASSLPITSKKWIVYFEGGGWCYSPEDCLLRSKTELGSSTDYKSTKQRPGGPFSNDCSVNPTFCDYHLVYMKYCDGNSFAGNRTSPLVVQKNKEVYLRGAEIRQAVLNHLLSTTLFLNATEVLLTGCSAGGLATFLHAEQMWNWLAVMIPNLQKFGAMPISGYFLNHRNTLGQPAYRDDMKTIFYLSEAGKNGGLSPSCLAAYSEKKKMEEENDDDDNKRSSSNDDESWRCNFAAYVAHHIPAHVPVFIINSKMDMWQLPCILAKKPNISDFYAACYGIPPYDKPPLNCNKYQWPEKFCFVSNATNADARGYATTLIKELFSTPQFDPTRNTSSSSSGKPVTEKGEEMKYQNGAFINSCFTHCEGQNQEDWGKLTVRGVSMKDAVKSWWESIGLQEEKSSSSLTRRSSSSSSASHFYNDCDWPVGSTATCNPTCVPPPRQNEGR